MQMESNLWVLCSQQKLNQITRSDFYQSFTNAWRIIGLIHAISDAEGALLLLLLFLCFNGTNCYPLRQRDLLQDFCLLGQMEQTLQLHSEFGYDNMGTLAHAVDTLMKHACWQACFYKEGFMEWAGRPLSQRAVSVRLHSKCQRVDVH